MIGSVPIAGQITLPKTPSALDVANGRRFVIALVKLSLGMGVMEFMGAITMEMRGLQSHLLRSMGEFVLQGANKRARRAAKRYAEQQCQNGVDDDTAADGDVSMGDSAKTQLVVSPAPEQCANSLQWLKSAANQWRCTKSSCRLWSSH